jgi:hypothetical protein
MARWHEIAEPVAVTVKLLPGATTPVSLLPLLATM